GPARPEPVRPASEESESVPMAQPSAPPERIPDAPAAPQAVAAEVPEGQHAPSAGSLDLQTIRRSWQQLLDRLQDKRQMILHANLVSVTPAAYDGATLELAFPPGRRFSVQKVQQKEDDLRAIFAEVFGVSPRLVCVARDEAAGGPTVEEEPPLSREDVLARL